MVTPQDSGPLWDKINATREDVATIKAEMEGFRRAQQRNEEEVRRALEKIERRQGRIEMLIGSIGIGAAITIWRIVSDGIGIPL